MDWKDINPRLAAAYDLFGNGKTAIKASLSRGSACGRHFVRHGPDLTNPYGRAGQHDNRSFTDFNGTSNSYGQRWEFHHPLGSRGNGCVPATRSGCALGPPECGFLHSVKRRQRDLCIGCDPGLAEPRRRLADVGFRPAGDPPRFRAEFRFLSDLVRKPSRGPKRDTRRVASNYDQYCVTPPASTAYPGFGGTQLCNLYDPISTQLANANTYAVEQASIFGKESDVYTGIDVLANARFRGITLQGGVTAGHEVTNYCVQVNSPEDLSYSLQTRPRPLRLLSNSRTTISARLMMPRRATSTRRGTRICSSR